jgi:adenylate cyclase
MSAITLLLIDDDEAYSTELKELLEYNGYFVVTAENGSKGLIMARNYQPAIILCDYNMPVMDGCEFVKQLRQEPLITQTPVLLVSSLADQLAREKKLAGPIQYLKKPFQIKALLNAIEVYAPIF